jgi:hypothetical protein
MMFPIAPFADNAGALDSYVAPQATSNVIFGLATNQRFMLADYRRYQSPLEPEYINMAPQQSPLDQLVAPPLFLASGSR